MAASSSIYFFRNNHRDTENDISDNEFEYNDSVEPPKKRGKGLYYEQLMCFSNKTSAIDYLKTFQVQDNIWSYSRTRNTKEGEKRYYECSKKNCPVMLCMLSHADSERVTISVADVEHEHEQAIEDNKKLSDKLKQEISSLYSFGVTKPKDIFHQLSKKNIKNITTSQISNFIQRFKKKELPPASSSLNDIKEWCKAKASDQSDLSENGQNRKKARSPSPGLNIQSPGTQQSQDYEKYEFLDDSILNSQDSVI